MFKRIDQTTLVQVGLKSKQSLGESAIQEVHQFSLLQRFRQDRDMNAFDRSKPLPIDANDESESNSEDEGIQLENVNLKNITSPTSGPSNALALAREKKKTINTINGKPVIFNKEEKDVEFKWWVGGDPNAAERKMQAKKVHEKQQVEKDRYIKALKVLVNEKGARLSQNDMPSLCSCGALRNNVQKATKANNDEDMEICASNCQFYMNNKAYERALRDILHCISLFK